MSNLPSHYSISFTPILPVESPMTSMLLSYVSSFVPTSSRLKEPFRFDEASILLSEPSFPLECGGGGLDQSQVRSKSCLLSIPASAFHSPSDVCLRLPPKRLFFVY